MYFKKFIKKTHLLILLLAIIMPWQAKAQETVTVCDGSVPGTTTTTSNYIPIYGSYVDTNGTTSEFIIPATTEGMDALVGGEISHLTFYITNNPATWGDPTIQIYMGEVEGTTLNSLYGPTSANVKIVVEKILSNTQAEMEIELDTPYTYEGGNLLIGTYVKTKSSTYKYTSFSGIQAPSGSSRNNNGSGSGTAREFLPKTTFTYTPAGGASCAKPSSVVAENVTSNSATIYWTGESDKYNVQYKKSTDTEWIDRAINYSGYSVELTGLESNTSYQVQVQSICEGDALSSWKLIGFETPCEMWTTFPFYESFEDLTTTGEIPGCWDNEDGNVTEVQRWCYSTSNFTGSYGSTVTSGHNGTKCVRFNSYNPTSGKYDCLKTIPMNFPAGKTMQLTFWYKNPTGGDFSVYISTDGGDTYDTSNPLATGLTGQADWTEVEITLPDYVGSQNVAIVFKAISNCGSNNAAVYIDDVTIDEAPNCPKQSGLTATAVTSSSVTLDWTKGTNDQDHWDIFITSDATITPDADTTPTVVNTDEKPYTYNGLNDMTTYYAYVRARCSDTDKSPWTAACKFTTPQIPVTVDGSHPYNTDFEIVCDWLLINGDYTNKWCYGTAANNTANGEKAIYISNDNGETNAYSSVKSVEYATKNFSFAEGIYTFSYDWRAKGNQYYDFLRVALVPASVELVSTENAPFDATTLPSGWIALDGGSKLNNNESWQTVVADEISVPAGEYMMVFGWRNFTYSVTQPPAAIDNVSISLLTCPRPTNLISNDVTGRTTTLAWTENGSATEWVLEYSTTSDFTGATSVVVNETPSKSLTGFTPETTYYARVKASCSNTDESVWSDVANFTTLATCPKPTLSYVSNSNTAYTGSVSWTGSTADAYEVAYRPTSDFAPSDYTLSDVVRIQLENVTEYNYTLQNLTPETKYYIYIQANCGTEDGVSSWSNRVIFTTLATCLAPSNLTDESVTSTSVNLSWTKGADDQDAWQFRYKKTNDTDYNYVLVENHPGNTYTLQGLEPATSYHVNVRAWCGGDDYSKWSLANQSSDKTITTACAELKMPYTCDFEGAVETGGHFSTYSVPKCWNRIEMQYGNYSPYTYYPYVYDYSSDAHGGTKSLRMYRTPNSATQTIIMPAIDDSYQMSDLQIRFWAKAGSSNNTLYVGIMEGDNFVEVAAVEGVSTTYAEFTVPLLNYTGTGRNIAIRCGSSTGNSYLYFNIDDVLVEVIPTCWVPTALAVKETSYNSASLTWNAGKDESEWNIQYKKSSESEWGNPIHVTSLPNNENPYVLTGLKRGADYDVRVQAYCDADDQSEWCNHISFTTDCGVWPVDNENALFEGFTGETFPPACWDWIRVNNYYGWQHSTNVNDPVDPTGTAFSYWPSGDTYLILPHMHINGNAKLTFDMAFSSSGSGEESSVVLSTTGCAAINFTNTLWTASEFPTTKTNVSINLSAYDGQDVFIAFKFAGVGTSGRMWYVDNVGVYCTSYPNEVQGYTTNADGWRLIASPLAETILANDVINMTTGDFDLYRFNQSSDTQWENWKKEGSSHYHFGLEPGKGYLYANNSNTTLTFIGTTYSGDGNVTLSRAVGSSLAGWNLIGNPFAQAATVAKDFYVMNNDGSGLIAATGHNVAAMEGIMVYAENDGEIVTFVPNTRNSQADEQIVLNLSRGESDVIDRVIVRLGESGTLPKYSLNDNNAKIYVAQEDMDYAVVHGFESGNMQVDFESKHIGEYSFSVNLENADVKYLHLLDKITGDDVDMLSEGYYTFIGSPSDRNDRFVLRFGSTASTITDVFAYQNGDEIIVSGDGELQVFDMMGRMIANHRVSGVETVEKPSQCGVYIFKLNEKTQKIVVR